MNVEPIKNFFRNYIRMIYSPTKVIDEILERETNLLDSLLLVFISSLLTITGVFIYQGPTGPIYNIFQYYTSTFLLELLTSSSMLGYDPFTTHYHLIFIKNVLFLIKTWIFFGIFAYIWLRILKIKASFSKTFEITAWSMFPLLSFTVIISFICILLNLIPGMALYAYLPYYIVLIILIIVVIPPIFSNFIMKAFDIADIKVLLPYYLTLYVFFLIFTYNHMEILARFRFI